MARFQPIPTHPRFKDLTGQTFGRWTVIGYAGSRPMGTKRKSFAAFWKCRCSCPRATEREVYGHSLRSGKSVSCGCHKNEKTRERRKTHGMSDSLHYKIWQSMIDRCHNPKCNRYPWYGNRGIAVSPEWKNSFEAFFNDMGPRPSDEHSIERIDNNGDYCKDNCKWATIAEQRNNMRNNRRLTFRGKTMTMAQWAKELGINRSSIRDRLAQGMTIEQALTKPKQKIKMLTFQGKTMSVSEWESETGINKKTIRWRLRKGWSVHDALSAPAEIDLRKN